MDIFGVQVHNLSVLIHCHTHSDRKHDSQQQQHDNQQQYWDPSISNPPCLDTLTAYWCNIISIAFENLTT